MDRPEVHITLHAEHDTLGPKEINGHWEDATATRILSGELVVYCIDIVRETDRETHEGEPESLDALHMFAAEPGHDGIYIDPMSIRQEFLRDHALDMWVGAQFDDGDAVTYDRREYRIKQLIRMPEQETGMYDGYADLTIEWGPAQGQTMRNVNIRYLTKRES